MDVAPDVLERVDTSFYADPQQAAAKAMGVGYQ